MKNFSLNVALELNFRSKLINFSFVTILAWPVVVLEMNKISESIKTKLFRFYIAIQIGHVKDIKCDLIPKREIGYNTKNRNKSFFHCRTESFKNSFFPFTTEAWYGLDTSIINSNSLKVNYWLLFDQFRDQFIMCLILKV